MSSIVIRPKNPEELKFISQLLKKLGVQSKVLSEEELEDIGLSILLKEVDRKETVSEKTVLNKLL